MLKNVTAKGNATVGVEHDGKVRTEDIKLDFTFSDMAMDFQNLGLTAVYCIQLCKNDFSLSLSLIHCRIHGQHFPIVY